jgi:shikimate dehydrogenase
VSRALKSRARPPGASANALGAATRVTAIFGDPVEHSLSPAMHNSAYAALGLDRAYLAFRVEPGALGPALEAIAALGILGVNLTVPHKWTAARMLSKLSAEARILGAVNSVVNRRGELYGDNTDARGLERDLRELGVAIRGRLAIVIGAGGGAAATILALARLGAGEIVIANRTPSRAATTAARFGGAGRLPKPVLQPRGLDVLTDGAILKRASLIVNATPMGLTTRRFASLDYRATAPRCFFYDLIYAPKPTPFLAPAAALGRRVADGAGMLVHQGELAFRLFNGMAPPTGVMRRALMDALGRG